MKKFESAIRHLRKNDARMQEVIDTIGPCTLKLEGNRLRMLVRAIVGQQLSAPAAITIFSRVEAILGVGNFEPGDVLSAETSILKSAGLSIRKIDFIKGIARRVENSEIRLAKIGYLTDANIIAELTKLKGVGTWTAQMFLIFCLGRLDVLPYDDVALKLAMKRIYSLVDHPDNQAMDKIALQWKPFSSVGSWYCWQIHDQSRQFKPTK